MQEKFSNISHPLVRDGRSQSDRQLASLSPESIKIDGRSMEEILEYIFNYAQMVNFVNPQNFDLSHKDNWINFFKNSDAFQLALISRFDYQKIKTDYQDLFQDITIFSSPESFHLTIDLLSDAIFQIARWQQSLAAGNSDLKATIDNLISTNLAQVLRQLVACINTARQWGYQPRQSFHSLQWGLSSSDFYNGNDPFKER